jgi:hypothetical protein
MNLKEQNNLIRAAAAAVQELRSTNARTCCVVFLSIEDVQRRRTELRSCLRIWETPELRPPDMPRQDADFTHIPGDKPCLGVRSTPIGCRSPLRLWEARIRPALRERRGGLWFEMR